MDITALEAFYEHALRPVFGDHFRIVHERSDFVHILLDGDKEDFFFTLYGAGHVRLYWCNECFLFDSQRENLVSSDTYDEIVYEDSINIHTLPQIITELVLQLRDSSFLSKEERVTGKLPSGYDERKDYIIQAKTENPCKRPCRLANILIEYHL